MNKPMSVKIILFLALLQGVFGFLRAVNWVQIGMDLFGQGILLLPVLGAMAVMRAAVISVVAVMYVASSIGGMMGSGWARGMLIAAVIVNLLLIVSAALQGAPVNQAIAWTVIPVIVLFYLFSQTGRAALKYP